MKIFILLINFCFVLSAGMFLVGCKKEQPQMSAQKTLNETYEELFLYDNCASDIGFL